MIPETVALLLAGSSVGVFIMAVLRGGKYERAVNNKNWDGAAIRLGGSVVRTNGWFGPPPMTLEATLDGVRVVAIAGSTLPSATTAVVPNTEVTAAALTPRGFKLSILAGVSSVVASLGARLDSVADPALLDLRDVNASDPDLGRAWLTKDVTTQLTAALPYGFFLEDGKVFATRVGLEENGERLEQTVRVVATLAARGRGMADQWERLAAQLDGMIDAPLWASDEACIRIERQGLVARLLVKKRKLDAGTKLVTLLAAPRGHDVKERFFLFHAANEPVGDSDMIDASIAGGTVRAMSTEPTTTRGRLGDRELVDAFEESKPMHVAGDAHEIGVVFVGIMLDAARLEAATALMGRLLHLESAGPYR